MAKEHIFVVSKLKQDCSRVYVYYIKLLFIKIVKLSLYSSGFEDFLGRSVKFLR